MQKSNFIEREDDNDLIKVVVDDDFMTLTFYDQTGIQEYCLDKDQLLQLRGYIGEFFSQDSQSITVKAGHEGLCFSSWVWEVYQDWRKYRHRLEEIATVEVGRFLLLCYVDGGVPELVADKLVDLENPKTYWGCTVNMTPKQVWYEEVFNLLNDQAQDNRNDFDTMSNIVWEALIEDSFHSGDTALQAVEKLVNAVNHPKRDMKFVLTIADRPE